MDPKLLIPQDSPLGYPVPFWFIDAFKVLGFTLHIIPMNLWYAGALIAAAMGTFGRGNARLVGFHIARALPFALAFGINFGIIPLLFIQVAYYQFFYPATILIAWPWFMVFWMVMAAYFFVYIYRMSTYNERIRKWGLGASWLAAGIFIIVGFVFANALSLLTRPEGWWGIFTHSNTAGAANGIALNTGDRTLVPRWLFMFGMAITTTAAYINVDAAFLSGREDGSYCQYASRFAGVLYSIGLLWFVAFGSWYIFGTRSFAFAEALKNPVMRVIFPLTMISPGLPWLLVLLQWKRTNRKLAAGVGIAQFGMVAMNAISRQWLQNIEIGPYANLATKPVHPQVTALVVFLLMLLFGAALIAWMLWKAVEANRRAAPDHE